MIADRDDPIKSDPCKGTCMHADRAKWLQPGESNANFGSKKEEVHLLRVLWGSPVECFRCFAGIDRMHILAFEVKRGNQTIRGTINKTCVVPGVCFREWQRTRYKNNLGATQTSNTRTS